MKDTLVVLMDLESLNSDSRVLHVQDVHESRGKIKTPQLADVWSKTKPSCRVLLLDNTNGRIALIARFLSWSKLWLQPETRVVAVGSEKGLDALLMHAALRNTRLALYLAPVTTSLGNQRL
ncbi:uncharacterized protein LOC126983138 [Eriocheir sinensis]|uniref:uncharacterized protein LOC126983138 n=1 Tax=Eriocheir sinensis TaxID=95602 RepID=UPI0021C8CE0E|nr:uncharacterized protein LOC126983138 [Eriocheir sinensis]